MLPQNNFYTVEPKFKNVTENEFNEFLKDYPRKLEKDVFGAFSPPAISYNDFELADFWPYSIVTKTFMYSDKEGDLYYCPEDKRTYEIMENYKEVFASKISD